MPPTTSDDDIAEHLPRGVGESWEPALRRILFPCFLPGHLLIHNLIIYSLASLLYFDRYQSRPSQKESNCVRRVNKIWEFLISFGKRSRNIQSFVIQDLDISFSASWIPKRSLFTNYYNLLVFFKRLVPKFSPIFCTKYRAQGWSVLLPTRFSTGHTAVTSSDLPCWNAAQGGTR